jgi:hypothetical protein
MCGIFYVHFVYEAECTFCSIAVVAQLVEHAHGYRIL